MRRTVASRLSVSCAEQFRFNLCWNLDDASLPLLSLPEHISGAVDLAITLARSISFPLFQSLYYNAQAGKYILMVMPKDQARAEFIDRLR